MAPLVIGWTFYSGFGSSMLGIALFLATLPDLDRLAGEPTPRRSAIVTALVALVFAAHAVTGVCSVLALVVLSLVRRMDAKRRALSLAPAAFGAAALLTERLREGGDGTPLARASSQHVVWHGLGTKLSVLPASLFASHASGTLVLVAIVTATAIALLARGRMRETRTADGPALRDRAHLHRFAIVAAVLAAAFLAAPFTVGHGTHLYARFLVPTVAVAVVAIAPRPGHTRLAAKTICAAAVAAPLLAIVPETFRAADQHDAVARLSKHIEVGSSIAIMHVGPKEPGVVFDAVRAGHRALAERGGRLVFSFAEYPTSVVTVRPKARWDELTVRLYRDAGELRPASDLRRIRYVLVHAFDRDLAFVMAAAFAPEGRFVDLYGEWMLFESRLPLLPIDAAEEVAPIGSTLQERARENADRGRHATGATAPAP
jgi:hypothetical protein